MYSDSVPSSTSDWSALLIADFNGALRLFRDAEPAQRALWFEPLMMNAIHWKDAQAVRFLLYYMDQPLPWDNLPPQQARQHPLTKAAFESTDSDIRDLLLSHYYRHRELTPRDALTHPHLRDATFSYRELILESLSLGLLALLGVQFCVGMLVGWTLSTPLSVLVVATVGAGWFIPADLARNSRGCDLEQAYRSAHPLIPPLLPREEKPWAFVPEETSASCLLAFKGERSVPEPTTQRWQCERSSSMRTQARRY